MVTCYSVDHIITIASFTTLAKQKWFLIYSEWISKYSASTVISCLLLCWLVVFIPQKELRKLPYIQLTWFRDVSLGEVHLHKSFSFPTSLSNLRCPFLCLAFLFHFKQYFTCTLMWRILTKSLILDKTGCLNRPMQAVKKLLTHVIFIISRIKTR